MKFNFLVDFEPMVPSIRSQDVL